MSGVGRSVMMRRGVNHERLQAVCVSFPSRRHRFAELCERLFQTETLWSNQIGQLVCCEKKQDGERVVSGDLSVPVPHNAHDLLIDHWF